MTVSEAASWRPYQVCRCSELVITNDHNDWARRPPGCVVQDRFAWLGLHFAPRRWLLIEPDELRIADLLWSGARRFEASGKWRLFCASASNGQRTLAAATDVDFLLTGRQCARTQLFDCPTVLARVEYGFLACVESSYAAAWLAAITTSDRVG